MAVVENGGGVELGINVGGSSTRSFDKSDSIDQSRHFGGGVRISDPTQAFHMKLHQFQQQQQQRMGAAAAAAVTVAPAPPPPPPPPAQAYLTNNNSHRHVAQIHNNGGGFRRSNSLDMHHHNGGTGGGDGGEGFQRDMRELEELLSKLNPMAEEFVPPSLLSHGSSPGDFYPLNNFDNGYVNGVAPFPPNRRNQKRNGYNQGRRRTNTRTSMAQREDVIRRTVYVSDIDQQVTEEQLAALFINCGQVVDCRICGDPNSVLRFAFIEFTDEEGARAALSLAGTMLGYYPVRVLPSKTAIAPVNPTFLPRSEDEREMCARTIYCTNIDKQVSQAEVKLFFESICGTVYRLRLLGDYHHATRIAFVEFVMAESAIAALNCSGVVLGSLPIRVSPSKTPVRPRAPRPHMH